jgi:hypothetical protein
MFSVVNEVSCTKGSFSSIPPFPFDCTSSNVPVISQTNFQCGLNKQGIIYKIGYRVAVPFQPTFVTLFTVCRHFATETTFYSRHNIYKQSQTGKMPTGTYDYWSAFGLSPNVQKGIEGNYSKLHQNEKFDQLNLSTNDYFARGHLNPNADHPFQTWMKSTYFYINQVPQWQSLNNGIWKHVEYQVKRLSETENLVVYTGGHGQYTYRGHPFFMVHDPSSNTNHIVVPKFIWKLVIGENLKIAFVIMNDPFAEVRVNEMCRDRDNHCKSKYSMKINEPYKGLLSCCSFEALVNMIGYNPTVI